MQSIVDSIVSMANTLLKPLIDLGAPPLMLIVLTLAALAIGVKPTKALEGGIKLAVALTGIGAVMGILTKTLSGPITAFVQSTGFELTVIDAGWAPLGTITWGHPLTLFFLFILIILNIVMLVTKKTDTFDADVFNVWHLAFCGLFAMYVGANLLVASVFVLFVGTLKFLNADLIRPTFNKLLNAPETSPMTTTHMSYMVNPFIMIFDKLIDKFFPWIDKYDFDARQLNEKIGFWGSRFMIGIYLGTFIGVLGRIPISQIFTVAFTTGAALELFAIIGQWFIAAVEPLSQGISNFASKKLGGRQFNIGIDWPFIAGRSEIWVIGNLLAPILLAISLFLPGNRIMPMAGIIAVSMSPALLVVTGGKVIRMLIIGIIEAPLFLWAATLVAPFVTDTAKAIGALPADLAPGQQISFSTMEGPIEKFFAYAVGNTFNNGVQSILITIAFVAIYLIAFLWYRKQMKLRNEAYKKGE